MSAIEARLQTEQKYGKYPIRQVLDGK